VYNKYDYNMVSYKMVPVRSMSFFRGSLDDEGGWRSDSSEKQIYQIYTMENIEKVQVF